MALKKGGVYNPPMKILSTARTAGDTGDGEVAQMPASIPFGVDKNKRPRLSPR